MIQLVVYDSGKYQTVMERKDKENYTQGLYWFTLSKNYIQSSANPLSISLRNQSQITHTQHKEVTLNPTKPTHPLCTQSTPQARITMTLQDFTTVLQRVI